MRPVRRTPQRSDLRPMAAVLRDAGYLDGDGPVKPPTQLDVERIAERLTIKPEHLAGRRAS